MEDKERKSKTYVSIAVLAILLLIAVVWDWKVGLIVTLVWIAINATYSAIHEARKRS